MNIVDLIKEKFLRLAHRSIVRKTFWLLVARVLGLLMQLAYFFIIARVLSATEYGLFIGIAAMASLVMSFASFGSGDILIKYVSRDNGVFSKYWGRALVLSTVFSFVLLVGCLLASQVFFAGKVSLLVVALILLSDLFCLTMWNIAGQAFTAFDMLDKVAYTDIFYGVSKLLAAGLLAYYFHDDGLASWAWLYCASSIATSLFSLVLVTRELGMPQWKQNWNFAELKEGFYFSVGYSADRINGDIDKTMLASSATLQAAGVYGAGDRFLTAAYAPLQVIFSATYMRFFKHGSSGLKGSLAFARRLLPIVSLYGAVTTAGFLLLSPVIPKILGDSYTDTIAVLRLLSPYILILGIQAIAADTLTGAGFQSIRTGIHLLTALFNFALNLLLIPRYSWQGAAWATLISDGLKLVVLWLTVFFLYRKEKRLSRLIKSNIKVGC